MWIDLLSPTSAEIADARQKTGLRIPTRDDLDEIETSRRTYVENGAIYISLPLVAKHDSGTVTISPIGFVLSPEALVTLRFDAFKSFDQIHSSLTSVETPSKILVELIDAIVDSLADIAEHSEASLDRVSDGIFAQPDESKEAGPATPSMRASLRTLGQIGNLISRLRASLHALMRMIPYVTAQASPLLTSGCTERLDAAKTDVGSLIEFEMHLSDTTQFLLDATLGFINIAQNEIFRVLTVASVIGIPPTLLAGIWGMNFKNMPELNWSYGYAV